MKKFSDYLEMIQEREDEKMYVGKSMPETSKWYFQYIPDSLKNVTEIQKQSVEDSRRQLFIMTTSKTNGNNGSFSDLEININPNINEKGKNELLNNYSKYFDAKLWNWTFDPPKNEKALLKEWGTITDFKITIPIKLIISTASANVISKVEKGTVKFIHNGK